MKTFTRRINNPKDTITQVIEYNEDTSGDYPEVFIDGILYTRELFYSRYGYDWIGTASGRMLCFASLSGKIARIPKHDLLKKGEIKHNAEF